MIQKHTHKKNKVLSIGIYCVLVAMLQEPLWMCHSLSMPRTLYVSFSLTGNFIPVH